MAKSIRYITYKGFLPGDYEITSKINPIYNSQVDRSRGDEPSIKAGLVSLQRAHKVLYDVLRSNVWIYFVTLTFGDEERDNDQYCRDQFSKWSKEMKSNFPNLYYVAVPEYHKRGCLHFHLVVGGVSDVELGLVDSGRVYHLGRSWLRSDFEYAGYEYNLEKGEGATIYNVTSWCNGWSTVTKVRSTGAVSCYISKYLSKVHLDPRFYNKKRFFTSHNVNRPTIKKESIEGSLHTKIDRLSFVGADLAYENFRLKYRKYDVDLSKEDIIKLRLMGAIPMQKHDLPFDVE